MGRTCLLEGLQSNVLGRPGTLSPRTVSSDFLLSMLGTCILCDGCSMLLLHLLQGFEGLTQRISEYQAEREARAAAAKAEEEAKKLKECSFAPDINRQRVQAKVGGGTWSAGGRHGDGELGKPG